MIILVLQALVAFFAASSFFAQSRANETVRDEWEAGAKTAGVTIAIAIVGWLANLILGAMSAGMEAAWEVAGENIATSFQYTAIGAIIGGIRGYGISRDFPNAWRLALVVGGLWAIAQFAMAHPLLVAGITFGGMVPIAILAIVAAPLLWLIIRLGKIGDIGHGIQWVTGLGKPKKKDLTPIQQAMQAGIMKALLKGEINPEEAALQAQAFGIDLGIPPTSIPFRPQPAAPPPPPYNPPAAPPAPMGGAGNPGPQWPPLPRR